jgi:hypothetical protein
MDDYNTAEHPGLEGPRVFDQVDSQRQKPLKYESIGTRSPNMRSHGRAESAQILIEANHGATELRQMDSVSSSTATNIQNRRTVCRFNYLRPEFAHQGTRLRRLVGEPPARFDLQLRLAMNFTHCVL